MVSVVSGVVDSVNAALLLVAWFSRERDSTTANTILQAHNMLDMSIGQVITTNGTARLSAAQLMPLLEQH